MMKSVKVASYLPCFCLWSLVLTAETSSFVHPANGLVFANVGDNMILQCSCQSESMTAFHWYKQTLGEKPSLISTFNKHDPNVVVSKEFKNNHRFSVNHTQDSYHLKIANLSISDSAIYYCMNSDMYVSQFEKIYIVHVTSLHLNTPVEVHQSPSESIQSGDSVTLNCTVHIGTCDEERTVYWFRTSGESEPELIYAHGARNDHCERKNNTCFYNLPMKNMISKAGSYYCAVAVCGRILFGVGTKLEIEHKVSSADPLVYFLTCALVFATIVCILLVLSLFKLRKRSSSQRTDIQTDPSYEMTEMVLHYAAIRNHKVNKSRWKSDRTENECVYSLQMLQKS